ncbi:MAG TPA: Crp/Fnr family transcriptional regulator [Anaerolineaceae bacterium]|nr:Crp/Fnr family transcriptional regulator [Anaerolineaceae bacterium]
MPTIEQLQKYPIFEAVPEDDMMRLAPHIHKRAFAKGVYLFFPGSSCTNTYLVVSGLVRLFFTNANGDEFLLNLLRTGKVFGLPVLMEGEMRLMGAAAYEDSVVFSIPSALLVENLPSMPQLAVNLYREVSISARALLIHTCALVTLPLNARLAFLILRLSQMWQTGDCIEMPVRQAELAGWLGASRGRLNRAIRELQKSNMIRLEEDQRILILDRAGLERLATTGT